MRKALIATLAVTAALVVVAFDEASADQRTYPLLGSALAAGRPSVIADGSDQFHCSACSLSRLGH